MAAENQSVFDSVTAKIQQDVAEAQNEWLSRTPDENISLLNAESHDTGVYGFVYAKDESEVSQIPGMNTVSYQIPDDPNGGMYVGYESYEQTFEKAQAEYQQIIADGGTPTAEQEETFANATKLYSDKKTEYDTFLADNPNVPDYLSAENPVDTYVDSAPSMTPEVNPESTIAANDKSMSMDAIDESIEKGEIGTLRTSSVEAPTEEYVARISDTVDAETINGMTNYKSPNGTEIPAVTAEAGTDEYGAEMVARMRAIDKDLAATDDSYVSSFPDNMRYYGEGENPQAIPGMTLVVGKIEGAPGYYAGYESYDETYQHSLAELDAEASEIEALREDPNADTTSLVERQEQVDTGYNNANSTYDMQKNQYENYVDANPGNDFLDKENPVDSFNEYNESTPASQKCQNFYAKVKEFLQEGLKNFKKWAQTLSASFAGKDAATYYDEEEATVVNADYWSKRAALNPEDKDIQEKAVTSNMEYQEQLAANAKTQENEGTEQTVAYSGNKFRDIVNQHINVDDNYEYQHEMSTSGSTQQVAAGSTGNQLLDELSAGSTSSVDSMVMNMPDASGAQGMDMSTVERSGSLRRLPEVESAETERTASKTKSTQSVSERLAGLEERLNRGAASMESDGLSM